VLPTSLIWTAARPVTVRYAPGVQRWFFCRQTAELDEQVHGAQLRVIALTEEITSRHWLKILAGAV
jgi:hypothetical protein